MRVNSDAIYAVKQLKNYREGDNIRYTMSQDGKYVNAFLFSAPSGKVNLKQVRPAEGSVIKMYGVDTELKWTWNETDGLSIEFPEELNAEKLPCKYVWVLKIQGSEI